MSNSKNTVSINDFVICIATVNGSGSQSANNILLKTLFRMGIPVGGKNVFPSNIAGLPTWFWIRASEKGYLGRRKEADLVVAMNPQTLAEDQKTVKSGGYFIYSSDAGLLNESAKRTDIHYLGIPFKNLVDQATDQGKIKKMLINIIYVGALTNLLKLDKDIVLKSLKDQFGNKESVLAPNLKGFEAGFNWVDENRNQIFKSPTEFPLRAQTLSQTKKYVLMDGNTAAALGSIFGGCSFVSWYPITPSSSLIENFIKFADELRTTENGKKKFAAIQAEDELAAICMVLGAGWTGARAMTASSGPGISLMSETAGYAYYAEIPCVVWDVQRVGPSTGMPTRTAQGDILSALYLSHGDTKHPLLLPGNIKECFDFGQHSFDLAERLQQLVFVMSDLDLGMNLWMQEAWEYPTKPYDRGKVLSEADLDKMPVFSRYLETDGDAIAPRTLPGTKKLNAAYFTRGSGHNAKGLYTESSSEYQDVVDRLSRKWQTAKQYVPQPIVDDKKNKLGIIAYGSTDTPMTEARAILNTLGMKTDYLRLRALPFVDQVKAFIENHDAVFVIEQNRDGQMAQLLTTEYPELATKLISIRHYDGSPMTAEDIFEPLLKYGREKRFTSEVLA
ncbi:MAG: 2-oxoacid:acceptor oxidoreductase subunit alpha [Bdellovibrionaceae bacterium]|nr:2-oxoacid:acceptor oxidoreductase subunit alpha [Pseudobdellovibrionaceae bacterium]